VRHLLLVGEYELTIDEKNRLLIPAEVRRSIVPERDGEAFYLIVGVNRLLWLYPELYYEQLVAKESAEVVPNADALAYDQLNFAMASRLEWDKQGRVLVPEKMQKRTGLDREVTMIGAGNHLELWNRQIWEQHRESLFERSSEIALRAKQARQGG
jgi:MraZ protein